MTYASRLQPKEKGGQAVMVGLNPNDGITTQVQTLLSRGVGSVIYIPTTSRSLSEVARLSKTVHSAGMRGTLIAVDQEGGLVLRLTGPGFTAIPSAADQAKLSDAELTAAATTWGKELRDAGIDITLAPVADVVPAEYAARNEPVAQLHRGYGSDPQIVSQKVAAVAKGWQAGGTSIALKHYPGLGRTTTNTDFGTASESVTTLSDPILAPFLDNAKSAEMVMVSSVTYTAIDPANRAVFSPTVVKSLRNAGFDGVIISDDLGVAAAVADVAPSERGVRALRAGVDVVISTDPQIAYQILDGILAEAEHDPAFAAQVEQSAARVLALKQKRGLVKC